MDFIVFAVGIPSHTPSTGGAPRHGLDGGKTYMRPTISRILRPDIVRKRRPDVATRLQSTSEAPQPPQRQNEEATPRRRRAFR